jgi:hypothetical protein
MNIFDFGKKIVIFVLCAILCGCENVDCSEENGVRRFRMHKDQFVGQKIDSPYFEEYVGIAFEIEKLIDGFVIYKFKNWNGKGMCYWSAKANSESKVMVEWTIENGTEFCTRDCKYSLF